MTELERKIRGDSEPSLSHVLEKAKRHQSNRSVTFQKLLRNGVTTNKLKSNDKQMKIGTSLHGSEILDHGTNRTRRVRILRPSELGGNCSEYWARLAQVHSRPPIRRPKSSLDPKRAHNINHRIHTR
ncbi:hypothetical protein PIB30_001633 [Stylosanthes scabra]|uniref:Uncharacterized protein n=1 Tax=Stylosanthes scabra TaxID=79078 RepID=A0ABU6T2B2_9FABA|nr:hypothetical protein [Stylosanthes scabra]